MLENQEGSEEGGDQRDRLQEELEAEKRKNEELLNRIKYVQADMENYRKRTDREMKEAGESSLLQLVLRLLAVVDQLDLALEHADKGNEELREGIGMVKKNLDAALESAGVERIESVGKLFDPAYHEAVEKIGGDSKSAEVVIEELRPGFLFRGRLLRPSMVKVGAPQSMARKEGESDE